MTYRLGTNTVSKKPRKSKMKSINEFLENKKRLVDSDYMSLVLEMAVHAKANGDVPVAAALAWTGNKYLIEHDTRYTDKNPLCHAVINLLNKAADTLGRLKLSEAVLYTNIEPNVMCAMAIRAAGIREVVFGAYDDRDGFMSSKLLNDYTILNLTAIGGINGEECVNVLPVSMHEHIRHE